MRDGCDKAIALPNHNTVWKADSEVLSATQPVRLSWISPQNLTFKMEISLDEHYLFNVKQSVENQSGEAITLFPYGLLHRLRDMNNTQYAILHEGAIGSMRGVLEELRYEDLMEDREVNFKQTKGWLGITNCS